MKTIREEHGWSQGELAKRMVDIGWASFYQTTISRIEKGERPVRLGEAAKALRRDLFGLPGYADPNTAISYRDAQDRAASIEDEQTALRLLNRAELSGDTSLAKAVAARAFEAGWNVAINQYADSNPTSEAKFNELIEIESYGKGSAGFAQILGAAMTYSVEKPSELGMYNIDSQIVALANSDD